MNIAKSLRTSFIKHIQCLLLLAFVFVAPWYIGYDWNFLFHNLISLRLKTKISIQALTENKTAVNTEVFMTLWSIYDVAFSAKTVNSVQRLTFFRKRLHHNCLAVSYPSTTIPSRSCSAVVFAESFVLNFNIIMSSYRN